MLLSSVVPTKIKHLTTVIQYKVGEHMNKKLSTGLTVLGCSLVLLLGVAPQANAITDGISNASFAWSAGSVTITVTALNADPASVGNVLSGLSFNTTDGSVGTSLTSSSGLERTIASDGTFTNGGSVSTGWGFGNLSGTNELCVVCPASGVNSPAPSATPSHLIIGSAGADNVYQSNSSIAGNGPHNPFLRGGDGSVVTFTIAGNFTADTRVTTFQFTYGTTFSGTPPSTPEPASLLLLGAGLTGLGIWRSRKGRA